MALSLVAVGAKITAAIMNGVINAVNAGGAVLVPPTSVAGTGVSMTTLGKVTFTSATTVSVNGCFTGAYDNYRVIIDITNKTATGNISAMLRKAGTDDPATNYATQRLTGTGTTSTAAQGLSLGSWVIDASGLIGTLHLELDLFGPALAAPTAAVLDSVARSSSNIAQTSSGFDHSLSNAYDGLTFSAASGAISGVARVYGLNNG